MKIISVKITYENNSVCSSQVSTLTISIITNVLFSSRAAKILHVQDTGMKEAEGSAPVSQFLETSETAEQERNIPAPQGQLANPSTFNPSTGQHKSAHKKFWQEGKNLLAREGQAIEGYSLKKLLKF